MSEDNPRLHVTFYTEPVEDKIASEEAGHPVFRDQELVKIKFPADTKRVHVAPADECALRHPETGQPWSYKERFPKHYEAFKSQQEYHGAGTPLSEATFLSKAQVLNLQAKNIYDIETLADMDGAGLKALGMGSRNWKNQAMAYRDRASEAALDNKLMAENQKLLERIEALEAGNQTAPTTGKKSPFEDWADEDIKVWIKEAAGALPKGQPGHKFLVKRADEINAEMAETEAA